jgi:hypothetical protein
MMGRMKQRMLDRMEELQRQAETQRQIVNNPQQAKDPSGQNGKRKRKKK